jgi:hypothetical protein
MDATRMNPTPMGSSKRDLTMGDKVAKFHNEESQKFQKRDWEI